MILSKLLNISSPFSHLYNEISMTLPYKIAVKIKLGKSY